MLIVKMRTRFGDAAKDLKAQEIISSEVMAFMKKGVSVREEDLSALEVRIRARLTGATPVTNTLVQDKRAQFDGDEWAKIYEYNIAEGAEKDRREAEALKERQRVMRETLARQMAERDAAKKAEHDEEMAYAAQEQAALKAWEAQEEARRKLQHDIAEKLKAERHEQLEDKNTRRQLALARVRAEEEEMAARIAYETRSEFEKEEATRVAAKVALKEYLLSNEVNKKLKEEAKHKAWEEDQYYKEAWEAVLDKQERERKERLTRNMVRQAKTAEYAASGKLPEYKRWVDPAVIEKHWRENEAKLDADDKARKQRAHDTALAMQRRLEEQMKEREDAKEAVRRADEAKAAVVLQRAAAEEEREQAKRSARDSAKLKFKMQLEQQMKDNVARRRNQPISDVERSLNRDLLAKVHDWKLTGTVRV